MSFVGKAVILSGLKFINSGLGFLLGLMVARVLGANAVTDALFIAMIVPVHLARQLPQFMSIALVPTLVEAQLQEDRHVAPLIMGWWLLILAGCSLILGLLGPWIVRLCAPGFDPAATQQAYRFLLLLLPSFACFGLFAAGQAFFVARRRFYAPEFTSLAYKIAGLAALFGLGLGYGPQAYAAGLSVAAFLQLVLLAAMASGPTRFLRFSRPRVDREVLRPVMKGGAAMLLIIVFSQLRAVTEQIFASLLPAGSVSILFYASRVAKALPYLLALSLFTLLLPEISAEQAKQGDTRRIGGTLALLLLCVGVPMALLLLWGCQDLAGLVLGQGKLDGKDLLSAGHTIAALALGLPAIICSIGLRGLVFVARDVREVLRFSVLSVVIHVPSCALLFQHGLTGIALAAGLTEWVLLVYLWRRMRVQFPSWRRWWPLAAATAVMAAVLVGVPWSYLIPHALLRLAVGSAVALACYGASLYPLRTILRGLHDTFRESST